MYVYITYGFSMALINTLVLSARSQDSLLSVSVPRVRIVSSTAGFKVRGKPCPKPLKPTAERHPESLAHLASKEPEQTPNFFIF